MLAPLSVDQDSALRRAAEIFRVLGDPTRLRLLGILLDGERCVSDLADRLQDNLPAVSQRLKLLRAAGIVSGRRNGKRIYYALADDHIRDLLVNALAHAAELTRADPGRLRMGNHAPTRNSIAQT
jgi:DNA-binding transcriptional ArsR family regulator